MVGTRRPRLALVSRCGGHTTIRDTAGLLRFLLARRRRGVGWTRPCAAGPLGGKPRSTAQEAGARRAPPPPSAVLLRGPCGEFFQRGSLLFAAPRGPRPPPSPSPPPPTTDTHAAAAVLLHIHIVRAARMLSRTTTRRQLQVLAEAAGGHNTAHTHATNGPRPPSLPQCRDASGPLLLPPDGLQPPWSTCQRATPLPPPPPTRAHDPMRGHVLCVLTPLAHPHFPPHSIHIRTSEQARPTPSHRPKPPQSMMPQRVQGETENKDNDEEKARRGYVVGEGGGKDAVGGKERNAPASAGMTLSSPHHHTPMHRVRWDEETIAEHDKLRGTRQKVKRHTPILPCPPTYPSPPPPVPWDRLTNRPPPTTSRTSPPTLTTP